MARLAGHGAVIDAAAPCSSAERVRRLRRLARRSSAQRVRAHIDVLVVGAGVFGAWTAMKLLRGGQARAAGRRLGSGPCPRLLGRRIADDARRLRRRRGLYPDGARTRWPSGGRCRQRAGLPIFHETGVLFFFPDRPSPISRTAVAGAPAARPADRVAGRRGASPALPGDRFHRHRRRASTSRASAR